MKKSKLIVTIILGVLLVFTFSVLVSADSSARASVTVTIRIPVLQELTITSSDKNISVDKDGNKAIRTEIDLSNLESQSDLSIPDAINVKVSSNVGWHLLAKVENTYANFEANSPTQIEKPRINLKVSNPPSGAINYSQLSLTEGEERELAQGSPSMETSFSVDYRLGMGSSGISDLKGVGGDVVYTLMRL